PLHNQSRSVLRLRVQRDLTGLSRPAEIPILKFKESQARIHPGRGFRGSWAGGAGGKFHDLERPIKISFEPAQMRNPRIRFEVWPLVYHLLVRGGGLVEAALFHKHIAQQRVVERKTSLAYQLPRQ